MEPTANNQANDFKNRFLAIVKHIVEEVNPKQDFKNLFPRERYDECMKEIFSNLLGLEKTVKEKNGIDVDDIHNAYMHAFLKVAEKVDNNVELVILYDFFCARIQRDVQVILDKNTGRSIAEIIVAHIGKPKKD